jgi:hypothetical protein
MFVRRAMGKAAKFSRMVLGAGVDLTSFWKPSTI